MMRIGLVGRGRAARTLEPLLRAADLAPAWWWSRGDGEAIEDLPGVDVVLLAVSDDGIEDAAATLSRRAGAGEEIWLHLSGSRQAAACRISDTVPGAVGRLHPLQALTGAEVPPSHLHGVTAAIGGDAQALVVAEALASRLGMKVTRVAEEDLALYHAAAVTVAGHSTALFAQAMAMLQACGFGPDEARGALRPLMLGTLDNLDASTPAEAITGPIARGDTSTVAAHVEALDTLDKDLARTYRLLARQALALSESELPPLHATALRTILRDPT